MPRARSNGIAFTVGWLAGLTIFGALMLVISSGNATQGSGAPATWTCVLQLVFGLLFLALAVHSWRGRSRPGEEAEMPRWMQALDTFTAAKMLGLAALLSGLNPRRSPGSARKAPREL
jgi:hypothetical protein